MSALFRFSIFILALAVVFSVCGCRGGKPSPQQNIPAAAPPAVVEPPEEQQKSQDTAEPGEAQLPVKNSVPKIGFSQKEIALNWMDEGKVRMKAKAREFKGDEVTRQGVFLDFSAELFEDGKLTATMSAPKATVDGIKRTVQAEGGVKMKSTERQTALEAAYVTWYANQKKVVAEGGVKIDSTNGHITAARVVTDTTLSSVKATGS